MCSEGERVKAGERLATLDPTFAAADVSALKSQIASLEAQIARCRGGARQAALSMPPPTADPAATRYGELQRAYYLQRKAQFEAQLRAYDEQIAQNKATIAQAARTTRRVTTTASSSPGSREHARHAWRPRQVGSRLNLLTATDQRLEILRNAGIRPQQPGRKRSTSSQSTIANRDAFVQQWLAQVSQELVTARNQRDTALQQLEKAAKHKDLVRLEAPEDAVVLKMAKLSVGSVLKEGDPLITWRRCIRRSRPRCSIATRDVGFIRPGDRSRSSSTRSTSSSTALSSGTVRWISEGAFTLDDNGSPGPEPYYKARIALTEVNLRDVPDGFSPDPGHDALRPTSISARARS